MNFLTIKTQLNDLLLSNELLPPDKYQYLLFKDGFYFSIAKLNGYQIDSILNNSFKQYIKFTLVSFLDETKEFELSCKELKEKLFILDLEVSRPLDTYFTENNFRVIEPILKDVAKGLYD